MIAWLIDPGLRATGLAICSTHAPTLRACTLIRSEPTPGWAEYQGPDSVAIEKQCEQAAAWFLAHPQRPDVIGYEWPTVYDPRVNPSADEKDPNDLLPLTAINLGIVQRLRAAGVKAPARPILARIWTKGTPKRIRQRRYLDKLAAPARDGELALVTAIKPAGLRHNTIDACHMGEWFCDLLKLDRSANPG